MRDEPARDYLVVVEIRVGQVLIQETVKVRSGNKDGASRAARIRLRGEGKVIRRVISASRVKE